MAAVTVNAVGKVKTFGAFIAGGLGVAVIASGLTHGWDALTANGTNPFVDGGTAEQGTDTAPKVGLGVKPTDDAANNGNGGGLATYIPVTVAWVSAASASPAMPAPVPVAPPRAAEAARQPAAATVAIPSGWAANVRATKAHEPVQRNAAPLAGAPDTVQRSGFPASAKQPVGTPSKHKQADVAGTGDWIGALMPGKPALAPNGVATAAHQDQGGWIGKLMSGATAQPQPAYYYAWAKSGTHEWERTGNNNQHYGASEWMDATWKGNGDLRAQAGWKPVQGGGGK